MLPQTVKYGLFNFQKVKASDIILFDKLHRIREKFVQPKCQCISETTLPTITTGHFMLAKII